MKRLGCIGVGWGEVIECLELAMSKEEVLKRKIRRKVELTF